MFAQLCVQTLPAFWPLIWNPLALLLSVLLSWSVEINNSGVCGSSWPVLLLHHPSSVGFLTGEKGFRTSCTLSYSRLGTCSDWVMYAESRRGPQHTHFLQLKFVSVRKCSPEALLPLRYKRPKSTGDVQGRRRASSLCCAPVMAGKF